MADLKISQLSSATALAGTEVVPVVQGGSTKKATIDQILAPASGKGIDFAAAGGDILTMYDEGAWTPTDASGASLSFTVGNCTYTRIGRQVTAAFNITFPTTSDTNAQLLGGLPFSASSASQGVCGGFITYTDHANALNLVVIGATTISFRIAAGGSNNTNAAYSGNVVRGVVTYFV